MVVTVFMHFYTVLEQRVSWADFRDFRVFVALGQIRKHGNLGKIFLRFRNDLNFMSNYDSQR